MSFPDLKDRPLKDTICLFDVDETLTKARQSVKPEMLDLLLRLRQKCAIGYVSPPPPSRSSHVHCATPLLAGCKGVEQPTDRRDTLILY